MPSTPKSSPQPERTPPSELPESREAQPPRSHSPEYQTPLTSLASNVHVKEDSGITGVGGLGFGGWVRHFDLQTRLEAGSEYLVAAC